MNRRSRSLALGAFVVLASLALRPRPSAAEPDAGPDAGPPLARFDAEPFTDEKTPMPKAPDWKPAQPVALSDKLPNDCRAYRLHEWVKIHCKSLATSSLALLGGNREGVELFLGFPSFPGNEIAFNGEVMFPVRRGDRRMIQWSTFGDSYDGVGTPEVAFLISEQWVEGEPGPILLTN